ncbi:MAG TPA: hypothetical protein PLZ75_09750 [Bacteroidales bacterium]|jgi:hypothetical protein|nr:hypothetical protein [Bacteroidales bacterium]HQJ83121.1 hypothetical protein [Bacteroidales bacterium]
MRQGFFIEDKKSTEISNHELIRDMYVKVLKFGKVIMGSDMA